MIDPAFMAEQRALEASYLAHGDDLRQSGFGGGPTRWVEERSPLVEAIRTDGSFLDVERWAAASGYGIEGWGVDLGPGLVAVARRSSAHPERFEVADAWTWEPVRRWTYVYALLDQSPADRWHDWVRRLLRWVQPGGRTDHGQLRQPEPRCRAAAGGSHPRLVRFGRRRRDFWRRAGRHSLRMGRCLTALSRRPGVGRPSEPRPGSIPGAGRRHRAWFPSLRGSW